MAPLLAGITLCRLDPGTTAITTPPFRQEQQPRRLLVVRSPDPIAGQLLCDALAANALFGAIYCLPGADVRGDYEIDISVEIEEGSTDLARNATLSLLTLTTMLRLTTSGTTEFHFHTLSAGGIGHHHVLSGEGRVGNWLILPLYAGLIGTSLGSLINDYRTPQRLQSRCLGERREHGMYPASDCCREYEDFLRDSFSKIRSDLGLIILSEISAEPVTAGPKTDPLQSRTNSRGEIQI